MLAAADNADLDHGHRTVRSGTERMCAVTRQVQPIDELIRFVVAPGGEVVADLKRNLPGRGLWISAAGDVVAEAVRRGVFGRGFKRDVMVSPDLVAQTDGLLMRSLTDALAMAGKAGEVITGFTKVESALQTGQPVALIHASDGSADGIRKLAAIARQNARETAEIPILDLLTSAELDLALGRSNVIHAALRAGPAAKTVLARFQGIARFRRLAKTLITKTSITEIPAIETSTTETSVTKPSVTGTSLAETSASEVIKLKKMSETDGS
jgi:hypothetical protein